MKHFNVEIYTGSPRVNLSCFREFEELERCLRYSDFKKLPRLFKSIFFFFKQSYYMLTFFAFCIAGIQVSFVTNLTLFQSTRKRSHQS